MPVMLLAACQGPPAPAPAGPGGEPGVVVAATAPAFVYTDRYLDLALDGGVADPDETPPRAVADYFVLESDGGPTAYTRWGVFTLDSTRAIVHESGHRLRPRIVVPAGARDLHVREDGQVLVRLPGSDEQQELGVVELARFADPAALEPWGKGLHVWKGRLEDLRSGRPALEGRALVRQGALDGAEHARWGPGAPSRAAFTLTAPWRPFARIQTGQALDVKLHDPEGRHMLAFAMPDGETRYAPGASFQRAADARLAGLAGGTLIPEVRLPAGFSQVNVTPEGVVTAQVGNRTDVVGRLQPFRFPPGAVLERLMSGGYRPVAGSATPAPATAGADAPVDHGFLPDPGGL